ncbi:MAG TPA: hypothetical protein VF185_03520 [Patescibacteria group bacterium]
MRSQWYEYKNKSINLRQSGKSIGEIERKLGIPRSTLSGWLRGIELTPTQKQSLDRRVRASLKQARKKAVVWHHAQKEKRILEARHQASLVLSNINFQDKSLLELALSMLYLGEGTKKGRTSLGNTNPVILKFFVECLHILYGVDRKNLRCELHLRVDQDAEKLIRFWSAQLKIPRKNFSFTREKRPVSSKTYETYKGVCAIECGRIDLMRRISFINEGFCSKILE